MQLLRIVGQCQELCWTDAHWSLAAVSFVSMFIYMPMPILFIPLMQEVRQSQFEGELQAKIEPQFLIITALFKIIITYFEGTVNRKPRAEARLDFAEGIGLLILLALLCIIQIVYLIKLRPVAADWFNTAYAGILTIPLTTAIYVLVTLAGNWHYSQWSMGLLCGLWVLNSFAVFQWVKFKHPRRFYQRPTNVKTPSPHAGNVRLVQHIKGKRRLSQQTSDSRKSPIGVGLNQLIPRSAKGSLTNLLRTQSNSSQDLANTEVGRFAAAFAAQVHRCVPTTDFSARACRRVPDPCVAQTCSMHHCDICRNSRWARQLCATRAETRS